MNLPSTETTVRTALLAHTLPEGFTQKLANTEGWSPLHASMVLSEYRRFLVLASTGPAAPSPDVEAAWRLHHSEAPEDWASLLTLGGAGLAAFPEASSRTLYESTLQRYQTTFGHAPSVAVWPDSRRLRLPVSSAGWCWATGSVLHVLAAVGAALAVAGLLPLGLGLLAAFVLLVAGDQVRHWGRPMSLGRLGAQTPLTPGGAAAGWGGGDCGVTDGGCGDGGGS